MSIFDILDDDALNRKANPEEYIRESLKEDYKIESPEIEEKEKNTYIVNCKGDVTIKPNKEIKSLKRYLYRFGSIQGNFYCSGCPNLESLEGAPQEVKGNFYCIGNESLATLKGAPQKVEGVFDCSGCIKLESLEGAPKECREIRYPKHLKKVEFTPQDIKRYLLEQFKKNQEFLFNELELQTFFCRELEKVFKPEEYRIYMEYHLPKGWNPKFDTDYESWKTETPSIDLVLEESASQRFIAIELKYKLKEINLTNDFTRFGVTSASNSIKLVTNQSAQNEGRYDFWKDVKRLELLNKHYKNVIGGIAFFITNDKSYTTTTPNCKYTRFGLDDLKEGFLYWNYNICPNGHSKCGSEACQEKPCGEKKTKKNDTWIRPSFSLEGKRFGEWWPNKENGLDGAQKEKFYCYTVEV